MLSSVIECRDYLAYRVIEEFIYKISINSLIFSLQLRSHL
ncbi:Putative uncharacterized protein [Moritella viscosa]|uniref:Uncharacterized protein n=1 Tax=Moritella viscosa TaxID=80854 RepID=A0A1K9YV59_9GAMM|nr:Putative uncharacterized protein [Moritella viscosa]SGY86685.1 Putative uncharacterized protein [Moritella viscosa]SHN99717.1 Putative uncharacterized protein [Moritella viscosa]SHO05393.1 Putative uncharacterized protein [Moritella viscosa]SHO20206.1 Putative uncharacterized protein [Moritella viscosa]